MTRKLLVAFIVFLVVLLGACLVTFTSPLFRPARQELSCRVHVHTIYYFWEGTPSPFVTYCTQSWSRVYPHATVVRLNLDWFRTHVDTFKLAPKYRENQHLNGTRTDTNPLLLSDILRLVCLYEFGGTYLDASILLVNPICTAAATCRDDVVWMCPNLNYKDVYENSLVHVAHPHHPFLQAWLETLVHVTSSEAHWKTFSDWARTVEPQYPKLKHWYHVPYYCMLHLQHRQQRALTHVLPLRFCHDPARRRKKAHAHATGYFFTSAYFLAHFRSGALQEKHSVLKFCRKARHELDAKSRLYLSDTQ